MAGQTLYDKVWDSHVVKQYEDGSALLYVDRHLVQEVSSPQAFDGLAEMGRPLHRPDAHIAVADHAEPTRLRHLPLPEGLASRQVSRRTVTTWRQNSATLRSLAMLAFTSSWCR